MTDKPRMRHSSDSVALNKTARIGATTPNAGLTKTEREVFDMADKILPTPEQLRELLEYNPETGKLYWKPRPAEMFKNKQSHGAWNTKYAGKEAFTATNKHGYKVGAVFDSLLRAHRVAWAVNHGAWPTDQVDHINGDRSDNRICNLRQANNTENQWNSKSRGGYSKHKGVTWDKNRGLWAAKIGVSGKTINLGRYATEEAARSAYREAHFKHAGAFARCE